MVYAPRAKEIYQSLGNDHTKSIIYSDALDVEKALKIKKQCDEVGIACEEIYGYEFLRSAQSDTTSSFGIGTSLTNDFQSLALTRDEKSNLSIWSLSLSK